MTPNPETESLKKRTVNGLLWSVLERIGSQGIAFVIQIILARILLPAEFGIVASVAIFIAIASVITEGGLGQSLVQRQDIKRLDVSTAFMANIAIAAAMVTALSLSAGWIGQFLGEPRLALILPVLSLSILISAAAQTQIQMLNKNMQFKKMLRISVPSIIVSGTVGIGMALTGFGVWALVGQTLTKRIIFTGSAWMHCDRQWRPRFEFSLESLRKSTGFSLAVVVSQVMNQVASNLHGLVIAKLWGMHELGYYNRAQTFHKTPVSTLCLSLNKVLFPVFAKIQSDNQKIKNALRQGIPLISIAVIPAMFCLITIAKPLVFVVLGEKWLASVPYLHWVPLLGISFALAVPKISLFRGKGLSRTIVITAAIKNGLKFLALAVTWQYGIMAMIWGQLVVSAINLMINDFVVCRTIPYSLAQQFYDWAPFAGVAIVALAVGRTLCWIPIGNETLFVNSLLLLGQTTLFTLTYLLLFLCLPITPFQVVKSKVIPLIKRLKNSNNDRRKPIASPQNAESPRS